MPKPDRSVFIEGDASGAVIFTGDGNNYFHVADPEAAEAILRRIEKEKTSLAEQPDIAPLPHLTLRFRRRETIDTVDDTSGRWIVTPRTPTHEPRDDGTFLVEGESRHWTPPWVSESAFDHHLEAFRALTSRALDSDDEHTALRAAALALGRSLATVLLDSEVERLEAIARSDEGPPFLVIEAEEDLVLALPWELLLWRDPDALEANRWPVRDGQLDLARTIPAPGAATLSPPSEPLSLLINVSAPAGSRIDHEAESYRISRALHHHAAVAINEMGELDDLVTGLSGNEPPLGIHYSGSGGPGTLDFEDHLGRTDTVEITRLLDAIRSEAPRLPRFFYLASCHGNTPLGSMNEARRGRLGGNVTSSAAHLHRGGIPQVVGHFGWVDDSQVIPAVEALYQGLGEGKRTRVALRAARRSLARPLPSRGREGTDPSPLATEAAVVTPFAWAQLVLYHRGPDHPLGQRVPQRLAREKHTPLRRRASPAFEGSRTQVLVHGFVGRRSELHRLRRDLDSGRHLHVVQGLGGLGKSAFCQQALDLYAKQGRLVLGLWCADVETAPNPAAALVQQFQTTAEAALGSSWSQTATQLDQRHGMVSHGRRLAVFLDFLIAREEVPPLALYLDNLESLMTSPEAPDLDDPDLLADWRDEDCAELWRRLAELSVSSDGQLALLTSCRYRHPDLDRWRFPFSPLGHDALFRMMGWFDGLRQLSTATRERLTHLLAGHPRSVEMLDVLIDDAIRRWRNTRGALPDGDEVWTRLVEPALPDLDAELGHDLLFGALWENVLRESERDALARLTVLRRPVPWEFLQALVLPESARYDFAAILEKLAACSLLTEFRSGGDQAAPEFAIHQSVGRLVLARHGAAEAHRHSAFLAAAARLDQTIESSELINLSDLHDLGYYLLSAGRVDDALNILWPHAEELSFRFHRHREALELLGEALPAVDRAGLAARAKLHGVAAGCLTGMGDLARARLAAERALALQSELVRQEPSDPQQRRDLSVAYLRMGDVLHSQGDSEGALEAFRAALEIREHLTRTDPDDLGWQRDLSIAQERLGDTLVGQGDLENAEPVLRSAQAIREELSRAIPENTAWQRDLSVIQSKLGKVLRARGEHPGALDALRQSLTIAEKLARAAPDNAQWQRDLSASLINVGEMLRVQGDLDGALQRFCEALEIARRMNEANPAHAGWLRQLSVCQALVASVLATQGDLEGALRMTRGSSRLLEGLAKLDHQNMERQHDLAVSHLQLGNLLRARDDLDGAMEAYSAALGIALQLARTDPTHAGWQRDLAIVRENIGLVLSERNETEAALDALRAAHELADELASKFPDQPQYRLDLDRLRQFVSELEERPPTADPAAERSPTD